MSKPFINKFNIPVKNVYLTNTIPNTFKDQIRKLAISGEYGKLEELFASNPVNVSFYENDVETSLLHSIIQSDLTEQQKNMITISLLKKGISINVLDGNNLPPIFYAVKFQLPTIVKLLIDHRANLNLKLPKGYDLFTTALVPSESKCPSQLFSVQDQAYFNKYYNQTTEIEREIKSKIFDLPKTAEFIQYLLDFCNNLPDDSLKVDIRKTPSPGEIADAERAAQMSAVIRAAARGVRLPARMVRLPPPGAAPVAPGPVAPVVPAPALLPGLLPALRPAPLIGGAPTEIYNTSTQDERIKSKLPIFNNNIRKYITDIDTRLYEEIKQGNITIDQIVLKQPSLITELSNYIGRYLEIDKVKKYPEISFDSIKDNEEFNDLTILGTKIFNYGDVSSDKINNQFIRILNDKIKKVKDAADTYYEDLREIYNDIGNPNFNDVPPVPEILDNINIDSFKDKINEFNDWIRDMQILINSAGHDDIEIKDYVNNQPLYNQIKKELNIYYIENNNIHEIMNFNDKYINENPNINNTYFYSIIPYDVINDLNISRNYRENMFNRKIVTLSDSLRLNHIILIAETYHKIIYENIIKLIRNGEFNDLRDKIKNNNPNINDILFGKILINILNKAIIGSFNEILEIVIYRASVSIINKILFKNIPDTKVNKNELKSRLEKKINFSLDKESNKYYLNENYSNGEPIDVILCINNNKDIIKNLRKNMQINLREYQDFFFKLGDVDIINDLNKTTSKKIIDLDIERYIRDHNKKFKEGIDFINKQLEDDIIKNNLEFFTNMNKITFTDEDRQKTIGITPIQSIYDDMIKDQKLCNEYLTIELHRYLNLIFINTIVPSIKDFLSMLSEVPINIVNNKLNQDLLKDVIDNIIHYHLNIDPTKTKEKKMSLSEIMRPFTESFVFNFDDPEKKQNIVTIYRDKMEARVISYITIVSQYALNIYRNQLRYIFNSARYEKIKNNIN
jgi:hypothetical protein